MSVSVIDPGRFAHRITVQRPGTAVDGFGHRVPGWQTVATVWAAVRPMGSNERVAAAQMQSGQTHVVTTRYSPALAALRGECRLVLGARTFNLVGFPRNVDEADRYLVFDCTEGGADGH
jgi:SPP1 family predicted phage head-tail adaptor